MYVRLGQTDSGFYHLVQGIMKLHILASFKVRQSVKFEDIVHKGH